jgi:predicted metal-dependent HD superfamily phosphohydrolase
VDLYEGVRDHASQEYEVELAIFLHDVIYDPTRFDNEARSAEWAHTRLKQAEVEGAVVERIVSLIVSTKEHAPDLQGDHALLSDIDLAILGARPERYREYQRQVRAEYAFVPQVVFDQARRAFLSKMLERESIFHTCEIRQKCGDQAESNLQAALHELPQPNNE